MDHKEAVGRLTEMWQRLDNIADNQSYKLARAKDKLAEHPTSKARQLAVDDLTGSFAETRANMLALHMARNALANGADK